MPKIVPCRYYCFEICRGIAQEASAIDLRGQSEAERGVPVAFLAQKINQLETNVRALEHRVGYVLARRSHCELLAVT